MTDSEGGGVDGLLDEVEDAVLVLDPAWRVVRANAAAGRLLGRPPDALLGAVPWEVDPARLGGPMREACERARDAGAPVALAPPPSAGDRGAAPLRGRVVPWGSGVAALLRSDDADGAARREAEERFRLLFARTPVPMWVFDVATLRFLTVNDAAVARYGWTREEFLARTLRDIRPPDALAALDEVLAAAQRGPMRVGGAHRHVTKHGEVRDVEIVTHELEWEGRRARLALVTDVTEQRRAAAAVRTSEARLAGIIDSAMDAVISVGDDHRILVFNRAAERVFGVRAEQAIGDRLERFIPARFRDRHARDVERFGATGVTSRSMGHPGSVVGVRADGTEFPVEATISQATLDHADGRTERIFTVILRDVTDRERLEAQLRQTQRMEAVGRLAGGVAHDFNNLLTVVSASARFLRLDQPLSARGAADLGDIEAAVARAAALTRQLLAFSRQQVVQPRVLDLREVVTGVERLLRRVIGEDVALVVDLPEEALVVRADPGQLDQVFLNLAVNARDAMPDGGTLTIRARAAARDWLPPGRAVAGAPERPVAVLAVSDSGVGMTPEVAAQAFEPFFTTKPVGQGTGLGLATALGIAEHAGGTAWIDSAPGRGTTVRVALPLVDALPEPAEARRAPTLAPGTGTVLLVEDDDQVRALTRRLLVEAGYAVVEARDGREALARWTEHPAIDALVTDVVMPDLGGRPLVLRLRAERPALPVVFVTGYVADPAVATLLGGAPRRTALVEKPFDAAQLLARLAEVLRG